MTHDFSASQINDFMAEPIIWALKKLYGLRSPTNFAAIKGTIFGDYLERAVLTEDYEYNPDMAQEIISRGINACLSGELNVDQFKNDWLSATEFFKTREQKYGWARPISSQPELRFIYNDMSFICKLDLLYDNKVIDIKYRSSFAPNAGKNSDLIQLAMYRHASGGLIPVLVETYKGKTTKSNYADNSLDGYFKVAMHNAKVMNDVLSGWIGKQILSSRGEADLRSRYRLLKNLPINDLNGIHWDWWPEAKIILHEYVL